MQKAERLHGLYAITDELLLCEDQFQQKLEEALKGGACIVQYRDKSQDKNKRLRQARSLRKLCDDYDALLIINDDIALCRQVSADGVHLGRSDASIALARKSLGSAYIIGASCYDQLSLAVQAQSQGADYVAFGTMFASPTKPDAAAAGPDILKIAQQTVQLPICAIGGITTDNAALTVAAGADMIAVISDLFNTETTLENAACLAKLF